ncbi:hypothetical protein D477_011536 [Arthrobacter crystallopoietes BAB-32]|uniref:Glycolipid-binding domain-containing protein n=1 Tax=Arthrobacter crystallopoietes BAB-32 TaxID=1246476 RepID=N1V748_9MICC|nr:putative glycolipid-binding domain-containing protein [Arthrobacter crystallopoietes]EMY34078.1 hypothetical protein D477_011536 [Arthrobacter crystallopoietes BAB-32]
MGHETHESRTHAWLGQDDPRRADTATINLQPERLTAHGAARTAEYAASWALRCGEDWITEHFEISVHGHGFSRHLWLDRAANGSWSVEARKSGIADLPEPGVADPHVLDLALDCDLQFCPATNTMPILRLGAVHNADVEHTFTMAMVHLPSLQVTASEQTYSGRRAYDDDSRTAVVNYSSDGFSADLVVDADGIVIDYPGLAKRRR